MKVIHTRAHGTVDYSLGILMISSPWIFGFVSYDAAMWIPVFIGASVLIYSFFTDYERGVIPDICLRTNLCLDVLGGSLLALSPWLFGFAHIVYLPHLILGITGVTAALLTKTTADSAPRSAVA